MADQDLEIRPIRPDDHKAVLAVVWAAFTSPDRDGAEEVDIVEQTWGLGAAIEGLDLVALIDGSVVAHVLGATADLGGHVASAVAPLSVHPRHQGRGIGSALMTTLIDTAETQGWPLVVLLGSPGYYGRFGFEPAGTYGIYYPPIGPDDPHFQVRRLHRFDPTWQGPVTYCWEAERAR